MVDSLIALAEKYGIFVVGGAIGAIVHRFKNKMTFKRFLSSVVVSMFVALCTGVVCRDYFELKESITYVLCGLSGFFSDVIIDEIEELIKQISKIVNKKFTSDSDYE